MWSYRGNVKKMILEEEMKGNKRREGKGRKAENLC
jgi:hypothetical protein